MGLDLKNFITLNSTSRVPLIRHDFSKQLSQRMHLFFCA